MKAIKKKMITAILGLVAVSASSQEDTNIEGTDSNQNTGSSQDSYITKLKSWDIIPSRSCNTFKITLPTPTIDIGCDLDEDSGNPSTWFNPLAACELEFDMIGLPSLGDIKAGLIGDVCAEIKRIKAETIDQAIADINEQIPDDLYDDVDWGGNLNDKLHDRLNSGTGSDGTPIPPRVKDGSTQPNPTEPDLCYTRDSRGNTITVPCEISEIKSPHDNVCYRKDSAMSNNWDTTACDRPVPEFEQCVTGYQYIEQDKNSTTYKKIKYWPNTQIPKVKTALCKNASVTNNLGNACLYENGMAECSRITEAPTQYERACSVTDTSSGTSETNISACINVEQTCYGFIGGVFKADSCKNHTLNYLNTSAQPQNTSQSDSLLEEESNDEYIWQW